MPTILLPVPLRRQRSDGDCLAACAAMALDFWGAPNDPAFEQAPQRVSHADFELAWIEFDYRYAVVWR